MIHTEGLWFRDEHGRTPILRGVNPGGAARCPTPWVGLDFSSRKPVVGPDRVRRSFAARIARVRTEAEEKMGRIPMRGNLVSAVAFALDLAPRLR
jgi:hypothetical protein